MPNGVHRQKNTHDKKQYVSHLTINLKVLIIKIDREMFS